jgi:hypothetical protein
MLVSAILPGPGAGTVWRHPAGQQAADLALTREFLAVVLAFDLQANA